MSVKYKHADLNKRVAERQRAKKNANKSASGYEKPDTRAPQKEEKALPDLKERVSEGRTVNTGAVKGRVGKKGKANPPYTGERSVVVSPEQYHILEYAYERNRFWISEGFHIQFFFNICFSVAARDGMVPHPKNPKAADSQAARPYKERKTRKRLVGLEAILMAIRNAERNQFPLGTVNQPAYKALSPLEQKWFITRLRDAAYENPECTIQVKEMAWVTRRPNLAAMAVYDFIKQCTKSPQALTAALLIPTANAYMPDGCHAWCWYATICLGGLFIILLTAVVAGLLADWFQLWPIQSDEEHETLTSLNGSHGEYTGSDDLDNIDQMLAQMANAQAFDNQPGASRARREARNHQHRRPVVNRRADEPTPRQDRPRGQSGPGARPDLGPESIPINKIEEAADGAPTGQNVIAPAPEPPRVATVSLIEIPSMGRPEIPPPPLYQWYTAFYYTSFKYSSVLLSCLSFVRINYGFQWFLVPCGCLLACFFLKFLRWIHVDLGYVLREILSDPVVTILLVCCLALAQIDVQYLNVPGGCLLAYLSLKLLRYILVCLGLFARQIAHSNAFTTKRFTHIAPVRRTLNVTSGPDRTHLALSGYTGVYRGSIYDELVDPCVAKYGTGLMTDNKQGVMSNYMREVLKTTYPGTIVDQVTFGNTVVFATAAILELQNTISSHTKLTKAAYASSSMM